MRPSRRALLRSLPAAAALGALPRRARATVSAQDLKFVFVHVYGGWDPTCVFAPVFDNDLVHMDPSAEPGTIGGLPFTDHPDRPSVRAFLEQWHDRTLFWNGIAVPSVGHVECQRLALTGDSTGTSPDWGTAIASGGADRFALPHVVVSGPQYNGTFGDLVTRVGMSGEMRELLDGTILARSDLAVSPPGGEAQALMDRWITERTTLRGQGATGAAQAAMYAAYSAAQGRADVLESLADSVPWDTDGTFLSQLDLAASLVSQGLARVVSVQNERFGNWDTHADNDPRQSLALELLFERLGVFVETLALTPGQYGGSVLDETVVVVVSEMGRTPQLNGGRGRDHWGTTSAMLLGPGITTDRVVGAYGPYFYGEAVDYASGELSASGRLVAGGDFGATLLTLAGMDSSELLPDHPPVEGVLA